MPRVFRRVLLLAAAFYPGYEVHAQGPRASPTAEPDAATTRAIADMSSFAQAEPGPMTTGTDATYRRRPHMELLATGSALLTTSYTPAFMGAAVSKRAGDDNLYIPIAGAWLAIARGARDTPGQKALFAIDGALQGLGGLAMLLSLVIPEQTVRPSHLLGTRDRIQLSPRAAWNFTGLAATRRF